MEMVAPVGKVYQAGTLSGNPLVMTAGIETLKILSRPATYQHLDEKAATLQEGIAAETNSDRIPLTISRAGSMLTVFFTRDSVADYESALRSNTDLFARFFRGLLRRGVYWPPSQFEAAFVSLAHSKEDILTTINAAGQALKSIARK